jgi:RHS repeat-associated protein
MSPGVVAESDLAGTLKSEYVFFDGERVARKDFPGNTVAYYFSDHLKTASVITNASGTITSESDYYPWGGELQFVNNDSNDYKFTGKKRDAETGLDYFGARYYSNGLGRWGSADWSATPVPVPYADFVDPQSLNLYAYTRNLPSSKSDVDGHGDPWAIAWYQLVADIKERFEARPPNFFHGMGILLTGDPDFDIDHPTPQQNIAMVQGAQQFTTAIGLSELTPPDIGGSAGVRTDSAGSTTSEILNAARAGAAPKEVPESIPAGPSARPSPAQQRAINEMGEAHGCHTCGAKTPGTKSGNWIGDHQPSTALNHQGHSQVYKPQCLACSRQQGGFVKAAKAAAKAMAQAAAKAAAESKKDPNQSQ